MSIFLVFDSFDLILRDFTQSVIFRCYFLRIESRFFCVRLANRSSQSVRLSEHSIRCAIHIVHFRLAMFYSFF
jgi:hypothetical protein